MLLLGFPDSQDLTQAIARHLGCASAMIRLHAFPDGESLVTLPPTLPDHVIVVRSLDHPDTRLVQLLLAVGQAREAGARTVDLVAPYLCYMRQDKAFEPGQAVSQQLIGRWLATLVDGVVTVDPHLHRIERLDQAIPLPRTVTLSAAGRMGQYLAERYHPGGTASADPRPLLLGPDEESRQWVEVVATRAGLGWDVARKVRRGDREVVIALPSQDYRGRPVILVDDVISSGHTLMEAARALLAQGASAVSAICTHALYEPEAAACFAQIPLPVTSCNTVTHASNGLDISELLADGIRRLA